jgi:Domain of unknown function (DUF4337)
MFRLRSIRPLGMGRGQAVTADGGSNAPSAIVLSWPSANRGKRTMSGHAAHEHGEGNKTVALVISILALMLAVSEIFGQKAQTQTLQSNIEASNLWAFYQAKTIRKTVTESFADEVDLLQLASVDPTQKKAMLERVTKWRAAADRYETEQGKPIKDAKGKETGKFEPGEGRKELRERASEAEKERDKYGRKHVRFEFATGAFQIAIVLASASIITGIAALLWAAGGLGGVGLLLLIAGMIA